jgi:hypothetical protein
MNMNDKNRNDIFQTFWSLDSNDRKKNCIIANTTEKKTRTYLDEENTPVSKKKRLSIGRTHFVKMESVIMFAKNIVWQH